MKHRRLLLHLLFWTLYLFSQGFIWMNAFVSETVIVSQETGQEIVTRSTFPGTLWQSLLSECFALPGRLLAVYVNLYVLIPFFLLKKRWFTYALSLLILMLAATGFQGLFSMLLGRPGFFQGFPGDSGLPMFVQYLAVSANVVAFTGAVKILLHYLAEKRRAGQLEQERLVAELQFLKTQINPHFFFNTLNNLYGLALERSDKTPELLLRLSDLMSYLLYESGAETVSLRKELDILEAFIELEKLRHGDRAAVIFEIKGEANSWRIPPLLLLPFVENAFKHGLKNGSHTCRISIALNIQTDKLCFEVRNDLLERPDVADANAGVGLENVRRRLALLLPDRHRLETGTEEGQFFILLKIQNKAA
ncbi:MAG: histidine kinase [Saprospiraceae bacterium]|nr:histidine kinase [Saprospiraceae bacterium]MDZ4704127.1 histidine kinase [Saprospiraceae bacterium]